MGFDLSNAAGQYVRFTVSGWSLALAVARHYGWEPAGIPKPSTWDEMEYGAWENGYWVNAGQEVTAADAAALTVSLDRAIAGDDLAETILRLRDLPREEAEYFRARLKELADLSRAGPFIIE